MTRETARTIQASMGGATGAEGSANPDKGCPTPMVQCDMDITETLVAQMRAMRLDDPELHEALMLLVSREVGRRVEKNSTKFLTEEDG